MIYQVKRIDPYWFKHPVLSVIIFLGFVAALAAGFADKQKIAIAAGCIAGVAVIVSTRPAITGTVILVGLLNGLMTFVISPNAANIGLKVWERAMSVVFYALFYGVIAGGAVILLAAIYNFFAAISPQGGFGLELEDASGAEQ